MLDKVVETLERRNETIDEMIERMDLNHDNKLERDEIEEGFAEMGLHLGEKQIDFVMQAFDPREQGAVDFGEFTDIVAVHQKKGQLGVSENVLSQYERNLLGARTVDAAASVGISLNRADVIAERSINRHKTLKQVAVEENVDIDLDPDALVEIVGRSCFIWGADSVFRAKVYGFIYHPIVQGFLLLVIGLNAATLCLTPPKPGLDEPTWLKYSNWAFTLIFTVEMICQIIALGFVLHRGAYLRRDNWYRLDFFTTITAVMDVVASWLNTTIVNLSGFRSLAPSL